MVGVVIVVGGDAYIYNYIYVYSNRCWACVRVLVGAFVVVVVVVGFVVVVVVVVVIRK